MAPTRVARRLQVRARPAGSVLVPQAYAGQPVAAPAVALLPPSPEAWTAVLEDYNRIITELSLANPVNKTWWYTWLAARDRYNAPLLHDLRLLASLRATLGAEASGPLTLVARDRFVAAAAASVARELGWSASRAVRDRVAWRLAAARGALASVAAFARIAFATARRGGGDHRADDVDVLVIGRLHRDRETGVLQERYFGDLPARLTALGEHPLVVGQTADGSAGRAVAGGPVPLWAVLRRHEGASAAWRARSLRVRLPASLSEEHRLLARASLRGDAVGRAEGHLVERAVNRLLERHPRARVIHMWEGNPWERAVDIAARAATPARHVIGYLHAPISRSHQKYVVDPAERDVRPRPDRVVCTGPGARATLATMSAWHELELADGCALRMPDLDARVPRSAPPPAVRRVLVVLDGLPNTGDVLAVAAEAAARAEGRVTFVVRAHPDIPVEVVAASVGLTVPGPGVQPSRCPDLLDDLDAADAVLYKGSSVAYLAANWGIPLVHFDGLDQPSDDPLLDVAELRLAARDPASLLAALDALPDLASSWQVRTDALRAHVRSLLRSPDAGGVEDFLVGRVP